MIEEREEKDPRFVRGGDLRGSGSIWGINATVCARLDLRLFAPLAFLFLEGDEMKRERKREGAWDLCSSSSHFPPLASGVLLMTRSGEEMHRSRSLLLGEQFLHAVVSQEGGIAMDAFLVARN